MSSPELTHVEQPFIDQLVQMGWKHTTGNFEDPTATGRESFREVFVTADLKKALYEINLDDDGKSWLNEDRVAQTMSTLERIGESKLLEANNTTVLKIPMRNRLIL